MTTDRADLRVMVESDEGSAGDVSKREKGQVIHNMWVDAGFRSLNDFANRSPFDRATLGKVEEGTASDTTYDRVLAWLEKYVGEPEPASSNLVTFRAQGIFGAAEVTVAGPVENTAELAEQFAKLLDNLRKREGGEV